MERVREERENKRTDRTGNRGEWIESERRERTRERIEQGTGESGKRERTREWREQGTGESQRGERERENGENREQGRVGRRATERERTR